MSTRTDHIAPALVSAERLVVGRGGRTLVTAEALRVGAASVSRLTGANGAGKTTLMRVLAGLMAPLSARSLARERAAYVPETLVVAPQMTPRELLGSIRALRRLPDEDWARASQESGLDPAVLDRPAAQLSTGMMQRIALLEALGLRRHLLLLDEPVAALDEDGREWLGAALERAREADCAVVLTDHSGAAELRCDRVLRIDAGRLVEREAEALTRRLRASHPVHGHLERRVALQDSDAVLRELLDAG